MVKKVDVAIIGAGSAGLSALEEVRKVTKDFVVIDDGPLGTMCARVGCMPSKALLQAANDYARCPHAKGRLGAAKALAHVRKLRDRFAGEVARETKRLGSRLVLGRARFVGPGELRVDRIVFRAKRVILATGSRPIVPEEFLALGARVVTTDSLFELEDLPARIGVIGVGPVGLEVGQALSRLGRDVIAFDSSRLVGKLTDPAISSYASRRFAEEFPIHLDSDVTVKGHAGKVKIISQGRGYSLDLLVAGLGRRPDLDSVGLDEIGIALDRRGLPGFDSRTMKLHGFPIYLAGDASAQRALLHEAFDDGLIAGYNSVHRAPRSFKRRAPLAITFTDPNIAQVGRSYADLKRGSFVTGEAGFEDQGRAVIMGENCGLLHVYAGAADGKFLGAEMIGPAGEHLAHLMAWALQQELTVFEMLRMPFYHPTVEEGLQTALRNAARRVKAGAERLEVAFSG